LEPVSSESDSSEATFSVASASPVSAELFSDSSVFSEEVSLDAFSSVPLPSSVSADSAAAA